MQLHFEHLNLRYNPFGTLDYKRWSESVIIQTSDYLPHIKSKQTVLFLGQKGVGKTSYLLGLMRYFEDASYIRLPMFFESRVHIPDAPVLFIDECQRLLPWQFPYVFRKDRKVVLGSHRNHRFELSLFGWKTKVVHVKQKDTQMIHRIFQRKIEQSRRSHAEIPKIEIHHVCYLQHKYGAVIRSMEEELYLIFQSATSVSDVKRQLDYRTQSFSTCF